MAEQQDEKPKLPVAGIFALLAMVSSFLIYQEISLQTSRPISKGTSSHFFMEEGIVQSRLWQDPFEAVEAYRLSEPKMSGTMCEETDPYHLDKLAEVLANSGVSSQLRILPVFVDGSPYSNGAETRLNDRYAVVSAFGAADYVPESGEYIRFFTWNRTCEKESNGQRELAATESVLIPAELFIPREKLPENKPHVLVLWLKAQDFGRNPFTSLNELMTYLDSKFEKYRIKLTYDVLGPRFSTGLRAMMQEVKGKLGKEARRQGNPARNVLPLIRPSMH